MSGEIKQVQKAAPDNFKFMVAARADQVCFLRPIPAEISVPDALELAAWICAMFDHANEVPALIAAIRNT